MNGHKAAEHRLCMSAEEASIGHHAPKHLGTWETPNTLDEVAIAFLIIGHGFADLRDHVRSPGIVQVREARPVARRKFHAEEATTALQHSVRFTQRRRNVGY